MSASAPSAMMPLRGNMPYRRAGFSASTRHMAARLIFRVVTPKVYISSPRVSTPGRPPGMAVKSSFPASFWAVVKLQWSVDTVCTSPRRIACHRAFRSAALRMGGAQTYLAACNQSSLS